MGLIKTTTKVVVALIIFYGGIMIIDSDFAVLGEWVTGIMGLAKYSDTFSQLPGEVYGVVVIVGGLLFFKFADSLFDTS